MTLLYGLAPRLTVVMRLSSQGKDVTQTSVEESSDDCMPINLHHEFLQFYLQLGGFKRLTPSVIKAMYHGKQAQLQHGHQSVPG